jgi:hypothetical protein
MQILSKLKLLTYPHRLVVIEALHDHFQHPVSDRNDVFGQGKHAIGVLLFTAVSILAIRLNGFVDHIHIVKRLLQIQL